MGEVVTRLGRGVSDCLHRSGQLTEGFPKVILPVPVRSPEGGEIRIAVRATERIIKSVRREIDFKAFELPTADFLHQADYLVRRGGWRSVEQFGPPRLKTFSVESRLDSPFRRSRGGLGSIRPPVPFLITVGSTLQDLLTTTRPPTIACLHPIHQKQEIRPEGGPTRNPTPPTKPTWLTDRALSPGGRPPRHHPSALAFTGRALYRAGCFGKPHPRKPPE